MLIIKDRMSTYITFSHQKIIQCSQLFYKIFTSTLWLNNATFFPIVFLSKFPTYTFIINAKLFLMSVYLDHLWKWPTVQMPVKKYSRDVQDNHVSSVHPKCQLAFRPLIERFYN